MYFKVYELFYSQFYNQDVSAAIAATFSVILLQEYKSTHTVNCVVVTTNYICTFVFL